MIDPEALIAAEAVQKLVPLLQATHDVFWENDGQLDSTTQERPFVVVAISIDFSKQASREGNPLIQRHGDVVFYAYQKSGSGTASVRAALRYCASVFELKNVSDIQFQASDFVGEASRPGWYGRALLVPFYYQELRD